MRLRNAVALPHIAPLVVPMIVGMMPLPCAHAAAPQTIYGPEDNRTEIHESKLPNAELWASAVGALVPRNYLIERLDGSFSFIDETLGSARPQLCKDEPFLDQQVAAICTGFLADTQTMVTAGHCYFDRAVCSDHVWVFDYREDHRNVDGTYRIEADGIAGCREVVARRDSSIGGEDYSVIKLDRAMNRIPLKLSSGQKVRAEEELVILGYPMGLPMKIAGEGVMVANSDAENSFVAAIDSFQANSGSPILSLRSGQVLGIMIKGEKDYYNDEASACTRSIKCTHEASCTGERVMKIEAVEGIAGRKVTRDPFADQPEPTLLPLLELDIMSL